MGRLYTVNDGLRTERDKMAYNLALDYVQCNINNIAKAKWIAFKIAKLGIR